MDAAVNKESGATVFAYHVNDPERYGVVEFDKTVRRSARKKNHLQPKNVICGNRALFYDNDVVEMAKNLSLLPAVNWKLPILTVSIWNKGVYLLP